MNFVMKGLTVVLLLTAEQAHKKFWSENLMETDHLGEKRTGR
jgi:hypothetical protein